MQLGLRIAPSKTPERWVLLPSAIGSLQLLTGGAITGINPNRECEWHEKIDIRRPLKSIW